MFLKVLVVLGLIFQIKCDEIKPIEYQHMPLLHELDHYDDCLKKYPNQISTYCYVDTTIAPDNSSRLWNYIEKLSKQTKHYFRHDRLRRGVCVNLMEQYLNQISNFTDLESYYQPLDFDRKTNEHAFKRSYFRDSEAHHLLYDKRINQYVNLKMLNKFGLKGYSEIMYCNTNRDIMEYDALDIVYIILLVLILLFVISSSIYDYSIRKDKQDHYISEPSSFKESLFVSFSFKRNYKKLTRKPETSDLKFINGVRVFLIMLVITGHMYALIGMLPLSNPEMVESGFHSLPNMIIANAQVMMQSYLALSGFLLSLNFFYKNFSKQLQHKENESLSENSNEDKKRKESGGKTFPIILVNRIFRIIPTYIMVILFDATILIYVQSGPMWRYITETERYYCRKNWWTNILFINNYVEVEEICLLQTWYLSTDFQLFILFFLILVLIHFKPKYMKYILLTVLATFLIISGTVIYVYKLEPIVIFYLEHQKFSSMFNEAVQKSYMPAHMNGIGYLIGVFGGWFYCYTKVENIDLGKQKWFRVLVWLMYPFAIAVLLSCHVFFENDFEKPSILIAIYGAIYRNFWGILSAILFMGYVSGVGGFILSLFKFNFFVPLGRLTFSIYLAHFTVIRIIIGGTREPVTIGFSYTLGNLGSFYFYSLIVALLLNLTIESPLANLSTLVLRRLQDNRRDKIIFSENLIRNQKEKFLNLSNGVEK